MPGDAAPEPLGLSTLAAAPLPRLTPEVGADEGRRSSLLPATRTAGDVQPWLTRRGISSWGGRFLDVGCGPRALTTVAIARLGTDAVSAVDPAPGVVEACRTRCPGLTVRQGPMEALPFEDDEFSSAAAQLVFHFVTDPRKGAQEMRRVVRPGGVVAAAVWDFAEGMEMLRAFWDAALSVDPDAPDEARVLRFGRPGELAELFTAAGLVDVEESPLTVRSGYESFDELWSTFLAGIGPAGGYAVGLPPERRQALRAALHDGLGRPAGPFELSATARVARGEVPAGR